MQSGPTYSNQTEGVISPSQMAFVRAGSVLASVAALCEGRNMSLDHVVAAICEYTAIPSSLIRQVSLAGWVRLAKFLSVRRVDDALDSNYVAWLCDRGATDAASAGSLVTLRAIDNYFPGLVMTGALRAAAMNGHLDVIVWLAGRRRQVVWDARALVAAAQNDHVDVLWQLVGEFPNQPDPELLSIAVDRGHTTMAMELWSSFVASGEVETVQHVVASAPLCLAEWFVGNYSPGFKVSIDEAAARGDLDFLQWAGGRPSTATSMAMDQAAANGHLEVVIWLHNNRREGCTVDAMDGAATGGHLEVVTWLHDHRVESCSGRAFLGAACAGRVGVFSWLMFHVPHMRPTNLFDETCGAGVLVLVQCMTRIGLEGATHRAMDMAAAGGHLCVVRWLHENRSEGCTTEAMNGAALNGHLDVVEWLHENRGEGCTTDAMDGAAFRGHLDIVQYLHVNRSEGCTVEAMENAAGAGFDSIVQWLHAYRSEGCTAAAMDAAIVGGHLSLVEWFHTNRSEGCTSFGMTEAAARGHFEVVEYLRRAGLSKCTSSAFRVSVQSGQLYVAAWTMQHYPFQLCGDMTWWFRSLGWTPSITSAVFRANCLMR